MHYVTVLGNDHAVVVISYNKDGVVIRDVLGPTSTGRNRPYEYEVDWKTFAGECGTSSGERADTGSVAKQWPVAVSECGYWPSGGAISSQRCTVHDGA